MIKNKISKRILSFSAALLLCFSPSGSVSGEPADDNNGSSAELSLELRTSRLYQKKPSLFTLLRIRTAIITISIPAKIVRTLKYLPGSRITAPLKTEIFPSENTETRLKPSLTF